MTSFHTGKCCRLLIAHDLFAWRPLLPSCLLVILSTVADL